VKKLLVALGVLLAIVVVAIAVVEIGGRSVVESYIRGQIVKALPGSDPTVVVGPGSLTLQALSGHLDAVDVSIPDAQLGTLTSDLTVSATDVPLDSSKPIPEITIGVDASQAELQRLVRGIDGFSASSITIDGDVSLGSSFTLFGQTIPYAIGVVPSANAGDLVLTPSSVTLNGDKVAIADLKKTPLAAGIASLVKPQRVCVADRLPKILALTTVTVAGDHLQLTADAHDVALATADFGTVGSCD
jgi:hypothetical protein